jgi:hypothetical protein
MASYISSEQRRLLQEMVLGDVSAEQLLGDVAVMEQLGVARMIGAQRQHLLYTVEALVPLLEER